MSRKRNVSIVLILLTFCSHIYGQRDCILEIGDYCIQTSKTINFRSSPVISNNVVKVVNESSDKIGFYLVDNIITNGFIKVKIWDFMKSDEENNGYLFNENIGWVAIKLVEFIHKRNIYMQGSNSSVYDDDINTMEDLKLNNRCTYSKIDHASLFYNRGQELFREKNFKDAISDFSKAIELWNNTDFGLRIGATAYRAYSKYSDNDYYGAIEDFNIVIENNNKIPTYLFNHSITSMKYIDFIFYRATCYFMLSNYSKALSELNKVISMNQQYAPAYYIRGQVKDNLMDKEGCCKDLSKAFDLGEEQAYDEISKRCK